jgi:RNA polymerase sigma factor (sigma-70 family)
LAKSLVCIASGTHRQRVLAHRDSLVTEHIGLVQPIARRIHATLPPSFDLEDLIATGNFALVRAATSYRPKEHGGTPFSAYARAAIYGAIKDTFRRNKYAEQTRPSIDNVLEFPHHHVVDIPPPEARIDLARRFASLRGHITVCLSPLQAAVVDHYYSPAMPELSEVGVMLGITRSAAEKAHASAIRTLRERLKEAA